MSELVLLNKKVHKADWALGAQSRVKKQSSKLGVEKNQETFVAGKSQKSFSLFFERNSNAIVKWDDSGFCVVEIPLRSEAGYFRAVLFPQFPEVKEDAE